MLLCIYCSVKGIRHIKQVNFAIMLHDFSFSVNTWHWNKPLKATWRACFPFHLHLFFEREYLALLGLYMFPCLFACWTHKPANGLKTEQWTDWVIVGGYRLLFSFFFIVRKSHEKPITNNMYAYLPILWLLYSVYGLELHVYCFLLKTHFQKHCSVITVVFWNFLTVFLLQK